MRARELSFVALAASLAFAAAVACSDTTASNGPLVDPPAEAGVGDARPEASADGAITGPTQKGRIIDAVGKSGVASATVTIGGASATTNEDGTYAIGITKGMPTRMIVKAPDHFQLNEQEWIVNSEPFDRGDTSLLSNETAGLLATFLPKRDPAKGLLAVRIYPLPPCDSEAGSTIAVMPAGAAQVTYFAGGIPSKTATSASKDELFAGVVSNVDVGVPLTVIVTSPSCEQVAFPVDKDGVTLTGKQQAETGDVVSFLRVFIGPKKIADSGTD